MSLRSKGSCRGCRRSAGRGPAGRLPAGPRWPAGDPPGAPCSRAAGRRAGRCARAWRASPRRLSYFPAEASLQCRRAVAACRWPPCRSPQSWPFPARLPCRSSELRSSLLGYFIGSAAFRGLGGLFVVRCPFRLGDAGVLLRRPVLARVARGYRGCLGGTVGCRFAGGLRRVGRGSGGIGVFRRLGRRRLAWRRSEVGEQFLPVELAVLLARGPGFQALATDFAEHHFLLGQVQGGSGHVEAGELGQRLALGRIDAEVGEFQRGLVEQQLGVLGRVRR